MAMQWYFKQRGEEAEMDWYAAEAKFNMKRIKVSRLKGKGADTWCLTLPRVVLSV